MKQTEVKKCAICEKGVMHNNCPTFYTVKMQRHMLDLMVCQRQTGLEMQLGGSAQLANVMGSNEDLSHPVSKEIDVWICQDCAQEHLFELITLDEFDDSDEEETESNIKKLGE